MAEVNYGQGGKSFATGKKTITHKEYLDAYPGGKAIPDADGNIRSEEGNLFYLNPDTGKYEHKSDVSIYESEKGLLGEAVEATEAQAEAAEKAIGAAQETGTAAQRAARLKAAQALSSYRGMAEGGRGFALSQDAAQKAGVTEASILADTAERVAERTGEAKEARTAAAVAKKKLLDAEKTMATEAIDAAADAQKVVETIGGPMRTTSDDIEKIAKEIKAKMAAATTPKAKAAYQAILDSINNKTLDGPGLDTWKMGNTPRY